MRERFPVLNQSVYLNTAYVGLASVELMEFRASFDRNYIHQGDQFKIKGYERLASQRETLATFLGGHPQNTFLTSSFSTGLRFVLDQLPANTKVLSLLEEYHSLENALLERGFLTKQLPLSGDIESQIESVLSIEYFDVVAFSMVQYTSGVLLDLEALSQIKKRFPNILFLADGTQFLGAEPFHFENSPLDVIVGSGYKWLLAGFGNGLLSIKQSFLDFCAISIHHFEGKIYAGHFDFLAFASLIFAIENLSKNNYTALLKAKEQTTDYLRNKLSDRKLLHPLVISRKKHTSIFNIPGDASLHQKLFESGIRASLRGDGIRISFHHYNTFEDVDRFFGVYDKLL